MDNSLYFCSPKLICSFVKSTRMNPRKKVAFYTLGCKLNFSETSTIERNFKDEGFDRIDFSVNRLLEHQLRVLAENY